MDKKIGIILWLLCMAMQLTAQDEFITTWYTTSANETVTIPTNSSYTYNYDVDWGDGSLTSEGGDATHTYATADTFTITITGTFPAIRFNNGGDKDKLLTVEQWGTIAWQTMKQAFRGCSNLQINASDAPDLSSVTNMNRMLNACSSFNQDINHWNVSNVKDMGYLFTGCSAFNQSLANWDVNQVNDMYFMFSSCTSFNQDIGSWNVSNVDNMIYMFRNCSAFNQPLANWDVSNVSTMNYMFRSCTSFNQDIGGWNVENVESMVGMFLSCTAFNQSLENWDVSNVDDMASMFRSCTSFNQGIDSWNVSNVEDMNYMFEGCTAFNQPLGNWDVSKVTNMQFMLHACDSFNQDISGWNVSSVTDMASMFSACDSFNQDIGGWDVSNVTDMSSMFSSAIAFDHDLGGWDMSQVTNVNNMFDNSGLSTASYDRTLIAWSSQSLQNGLSLSASSVSYCTSETERQKIIDDFGWTISDGGKSCTTTTWDGASWDNGVPTSGVTTVFNGDYDTYVNGALAIEDIVVTASGTLTVRGDSAVATTGNVSNYGTIAIQDSSSFVQTSSAPSNGGTGTYQVARSVTDSYSHYHYWSSPLQSITMGDVFPNVDSDNFYSFDENSQSWVSESVTTEMTVGIGYIATGNTFANMTSAYTFSSTSGFNSGTITITPAFDGTAGVADKNFNLIGNPYPSGLDVAQFLTDNSGVVENAVYLWSSDGDDSDGSDSDYATMNSLGTVNAGGSGVDPSSATISSGQGFFVQTLAAGDITFNNNQRVSTNNTFQRIMNTGSKLWLNMESDHGASNEILIGFKENGTWDKDQYDARKLSANEHLSFYSLMEDIPLAIQGLPVLNEEIEIPLGVEAKLAGTFTIELKQLEALPVETSIYLYDVFTDEYIDLRSQAYQVTLPEGVYNDRFCLKVAPYRVTAIDKSPKDIGVVIHVDGEQIYLQFHSLEMAQSEISIYDMTGRSIVKEVNQTALFKQYIVPNSGVWIVHVANKRGSLVKKISIN